MGLRLPTAHCDQLIEPHLGTITRTDSHPSLQDPLRSQYARSWVVFTFRFRQTWRSLQLEFLQEIVQYHQPRGPL